MTQNKQETRNHGLTADQVLRAAVIKNLRGLSYEKLAFNLVDSNSTRSFLMMDFNESYSASALQSAISKISELTWEKLTEALVLDAKIQGIDDCRKVRVDSTVTDSNIHHPTDSSLLYDCIRVINRLFRKLRKILLKKSWRFSTEQDVKIAKSLRYKINNAKNDEERLPLYQELLKIAERLDRNFESILRKIDKAIRGREIGKKEYEQLVDVQLLLEKIIYQTVTRVIKGRTVPSHKKIVSIFEPHTDIIVKDRRVHKVVSLSTLIAIK